MPATIPIHAKDLMTTTVVTLSGNQTLEHIEEAMKLLRFRHMPVVEGDRIIGLVTLRDALRVSASSLIPNANAQDRFLEGQFKVADVMKRELTTVAPDTPLTEVAKLLLDQKVGCTPVVEDQNVLIGIITEADFVKLAIELQARLLG